MADRDEFGRGDRVRARADGRVMTVEDLYAPIFRYRYRCRWADPDGGTRYDLFRAEDLEPAPEDDGG